MAERKTDRIDKVSKVRGLFDSQVQRLYQARLTLLAIFKALGEYYLPHLKLSVQIKFV